METQPAPVHNNTVSIQELVIRDMRDRMAHGLREYGTLLQAGNGRDALVDAYEEAVDLCFYLKQAIVERDGNI